MKVWGQNLAFTNIRQNNNTKNNNLWRFNNLCTDTFKKSSVSFTAANPFTPEEQREISQARMNDTSSRNRLLELKNNGLSISDAIHCIKYDELAVERFKTLTDKDSELDANDKDAIIACDIDDSQIIRFKEIKNSPLELYEAAWATKFELSNDNIETYLLKKANGIRYIDDNSELQEWDAQVDELMYLIKEEFNDEQLSRFAKFRNKKINLKDKTVRGKGKEQYLPFNFLVKAIKQGVTDEMILRNTRLIELKDYKLTVDVLASVLCLSDEYYTNFKERLEDVKNAKLALSISGLTPEQYTKYKELVENGERYASKIAELTSAQEKEYRKLINKNLDEYIAFEVVKLTKKQRHLYSSYLKAGEYEDIALELANSSETRRNRYHELVQERKSRYEALDLSDLNNEQYNYFQNHIQTHKIWHITLELAQFTKEQRNSFVELISKGEFKSTAIELVKLTDEQRQAYQMYLGETPADALIMAKLTHEQRVIYKELVLNKIDGAIAEILVQLPDVQIVRFHKLRSEGKSLNTALELAELTEEQYYEYQDLRAKGEDYSVALERAKLTKKQYEKYQELIAEGKIYPLAFKLAQLTDSEYQDFEKFVSKGEDEYFAIELAKLTPKEYEAYKKIPIKISFEQAIQLVAKTNLTSVTPEILEQLPEDWWYATTMGCEKEDSETFRKAMTFLLSIQPEDYNNLETINPKTLKNAIQSIYNTNDYTFNNGIFKLLGENGFEAKMRQKVINNKTCLLIKDENSDNQYIACDGATAKVKSLEERDSTQFETWGNLLPGKQGAILAEAAERFVFNIFDESGNCIIGQETPISNIKEKSDADIESIYATLLLRLQQNEQLTAQNILKIMPKDCMLSINPYINNGNLLYSIVAEWDSKENHRWQLEVHSQDLKHNTDEKWICRLSNKTLDKYLRLYSSSYDFNGIFSGEGSEDSHIKIPTPLEERDLLNNVNFQVIMRKLSSFIAEKNIFKNIANALNISFNENIIIMGQEIVRHCVKDLRSFVIYKKEVSKIGNKLSMRVY